MIKSEVCACTSKLVSVLRLLRQGWGAGDVLVPYAAGEDRLFACSALRPTSYFTCLVRADDLFARGIGVVPHDAKGLAYQAMLRLDGVDLVRFLMCLARNDVDEAWVIKQLKGKGLAIIDVGDPVEGGRSRACLCRSSRRCSTSDSVAVGSFQFPMEARQSLGIRIIGS